MTKPLISLGCANSTELALAGYRGAPYANRPRIMCGSWETSLDNTIGE